MNLNTIIQKFKIDGSIRDIKPFGSGHINSTYRVETTEKQSPDYILQLINHQLFTNVEELSQNILRITEHIRSKLVENYSVKELDRHLLTVILTQEGAAYYKDNEGRYWRVFKWIEGSKTIEILENKTQAEAMGKAFAQFQEILSDLPEPQLFETLANFHNTAHRIKQFKESIRKNTFGRLSEVQEEVDYLLGFEKEMSSISQNQTNLPIRNVHQDTKLSNILFDNDDSVLCVIDLDTVMPGFLCYDFGDAVRGGMNTGKEDDEVLENIGLNMTLFKAFAKGYYQSSKNFITKKEIDTLAFGAKLLCYEQSVRFLDDYLNGDLYYKISKDKHNLIRAKAQIVYLENLCLNFQEMDSYVKNLYKASI